METERASITQTAARAMEIELKGERIALRSTGTDPELVREVLALVSRRLKDAESRGRGAPAHQVVLLALLDLAEEYIRASQRLSDHQILMDEKSSELLRLLQLDT